MFCRKCGGETFDAQGKCSSCGWPRGGHVEKRMEPSLGKADPEALYHQSDEQVTPGIVRGQDGVLRWVYEMSLWKNPTILISTGKVLLISCGIVGVIIFFIALGDGVPEALKRMAMVFGIVAGIFAILLLPAYAVYALMGGGSYLVIFEMDEKGVTHRQLQSQFRKARTLAGVGILLGLASRNISATAVSYNAATRSSMRSDFSTVKKATIAPRRHVIHLAETLSHNQIYAGPEDFAFVRDYITQRLDNKARIIQK